jgi:hypothetical protein
MNQFVILVRAAALSIVLLGLGACDKAPESQNASQAMVNGASSTEEPPAASPTQSTDVCTLLSDEEIQQTTGVAVVSKKSFPDRAAPGCDWELESKPQGLHRLSITIQAENGRKRFDFVSQSLSPIADLGDAAAKTGGDINGTVWAVKGDTLVTLRYTLPVTTKNPDALTLPPLKLLLSRL